MIERIVGLIGAVALLIFLLSGWILYGHPLGFVPLAVCDILGLDTLATCSPP